MGVGMREVVVIGLLVLLFWPYAKIVSRAGYSPWLVLLLLVPVVNVVLIWIFAYANWPALANKAST